MKVLALLLLAGCAVLLVGCVLRSGSDLPLIQRALDAALPADFEGEAHVEHKNAYVDLTIDAGGLRRGERGWSWSWLRYKRNGRFSHGYITLGQPPRS